MRRLPRGKALIINVNEVEGKPPRRGTDIDRDNLYHLLRQLHFDVQVYNDKDGLTAKVRYLKTSLSGHQKSCMLQGTLGSYCPVIRKVVWSEEP